MCLPTQAQNQNATFDRRFSNGHKPGMFDMAGRDAALNLNDGLEREAAYRRLWLPQEPR